MEKTRLLPTRNAIISCQKAIHVAGHGSHDDLLSATVIELCTKNHSGAPFDTTFITEHKANENHITSFRAYRRRHLFRYPIALPVLDLSVRSKQAAILALPFLAGLS